MSDLLCFGLGYSATVFAARMARQAWRIAGTARQQAGLQAMCDLGYRAIRFDGRAPIAEIEQGLAEVTHVLVSIPPDVAGDPVVRLHGADLARHAPHIAWLGYLSTTGVYGDRGGAWVDERAEPRPASARSRARLAAEEAWLDLHRRHGLAVHIFRLAGIYGPGRSSLDALRAGTARRIVKPGQVFGRIHVEDVAGVLEASIARPDPGALYNVGDDEPAPPQAVVAYAAELLGMPAPPEEPYAEARLSPMAASFYGESKRVRNERIKQQLGYRLRYPTYREGLRALLAEH